MSQTDVLATAIDAKAAGSWHSGGLDARFRHDPNVFVAGDLLWYPVEGNNRLSTAPDVMIAFGRRKGDRGSYRQRAERLIAQLRAAGLDPDGS